MRKKWNLKSVIGYTDSETVKLDFDDTPFEEVICWALRAMKRFRLEGFMVLRSSENHYHVVFDRRVSWTENTRIVAWVSLLSHNRMLGKWFIMQCIKEASTLRISPKRNKPSPRITLRHGKQEDQIRHFLAYRKLVKNITRKLNASIEGQTNGVQGVKRKWAK